MSSKFLSVLLFPCLSSGWSDVVGSVSLLVETSVFLTSGGKSSDLSSVVLLGDDPVDSWVLSHGIVCWVNADDLEELVSSVLIQLAYLVAAVLFIVGLRNMSSARTASRGNTIAMLGMLIAVVATLLVQGVVRYEIVLAGVVVGSAVGVLLAQRIKMTAMPQMVALLNGFGGMASALVASAEFWTAVVDQDAPPTGIVPTTGIVP